MPSAAWPASACGPGQAPDLRGTAALIEGLSCRQLLADRAFDANWVREALTGAGIEPVIPPESNRRFPAEFDRDTCNWRHLIENVFGKLKEYGGHRNALLQDRHKPHPVHRHRSNRHRPAVTVNRPCHG
jgi:hypothetical protein